MTDIKNRTKDQRNPPLMFQSHSMKLRYLRTTKNPDTFKFCARQGHIFYVKQKAKLHYTVKKKSPTRRVQLFLAVWKAQKILAILEEIFTNITYSVNNFITGERPTTNMTQWRKQPACWERTKNSLHVDLPKDFFRYLADKIFLKTEKKSAAKIQQKNKFRRLSGARNFYD